MNRSLVEQIETAVLVRIHNMMEGTLEGYECILRPTFHGVLVSLFDPSSPEDGLAARIHITVDIEPRQSL